MPLPETQWSAPLLILNPNRRWWQWWKPRWVFDVVGALKFFSVQSALMGDVTWKDC